MKNFADAQEDCKSKFDTDPGKLFEPISKAIFHEVHKAAKLAFDSHKQTSKYYLTGYERIGQTDEDFKFSSINTEEKAEQYWETSDVNEKDKPYLSVEFDGSSFKFDDRLAGFTGFYICQPSK